MRKAAIWRSSLTTPWVTPSPRRCRWWWGLATMGSHRVSKSRWGCSHGEGTDLTLQRQETPFSVGKMQITLQWVHVARTCYVTGKYAESLWKDTRSWSKEYEVSHHGEQLEDRGFFPSCCSFFFCKSQLSKLDSKLPQRREEITAFWSLLTGDTSWRTGIVNLAGFSPIRNSPSQTYVFLWWGRLWWQEPHH